MIDRPWFQIEFHDPEGEADVEDVIEHISDVSIKHGPVRLKTYNTRRGCVVISYKGYVAPTLEQVEAEMDREGML